MKTIIVLIAASVLIPTAVTSAQVEPCDFNDNGYPDVADLIRVDGIINCAIQIDTLLQYWPNGDCDQDSLHLTLADELSLGIRMVHGAGYGLGQIVESAIDTISIPNTIAAPGQTITFPISIKTERLLNGIQFYLRYDPAVINITDVFQPDSLPSNSFDRSCYFDSGVSSSALPYTQPGIFHDPLVFITAVVNANAPTPSQTTIEFANDPQRPAYTGFATADSSVVPPAPDVMFIRPVTVDGIINIVRMGISEETGQSNERPSLEIWANPSNLTFQIRFHIPRTMDISLGIYDLLGRQLTSLAGGLYNAGDHEVTWGAGSLSSGIYFVRLTTEDENITRKLTLLK
jgi:hypothetical protein